MSEKVVYFLGAGFSAPFGLPVVSNFISLAKDQHLLKRSGSPTFERVFDKLNELARIKNSLSSDLSNIEEVLSILEMDAFLGSSESRADFQDFIKSVIAFYTPQLKPYGRGLPGNWEEFVFGRGRLVNGLGLFVAGLHRLVITLNEADRVPSVARDVSADFSYDVVTANYDLLLESVVQLINSSMYVEKPLEFRRLPSDAPDAPVLAKLHGSVDGGEIVPPTWSKGAHQTIAPRWQLAREALSRANHLRFIGYSLPEADAYVRYLLKFSMLSSSHLKSIDVLCLDPTSQVRARFETFVSLSPFRFANANASQFFHHLYGSWEANDRRHTVPLWRLLEASHSAAMTGHLI
mgnify:CR=1 FL=1